MTQSAYLFLGGPLDQQWRAVPRREPVVIAVECTSPTDPDTNRMVRYRREYVSLPGWVVPLTMYAAEGRRQTERGDVLPGVVVGTVWWDACPANALGMVGGPGDHCAALHRAIKRRGYRP